VIANWGSEFCEDYSKGHEKNSYGNWLERGGCELCKFNNFCYVSDTAPEGSTELYRAPNQWSSFVIDHENFNAGNLIGKDGSGLESSYLFKDPEDVAVDSNPITETFGSAL